MKLQSTIKMGKDLVKKLKRDHEDQLTKLQNQLFEESEKLVEAKNGGEKEVRAVGLRDVNIAFLSLAPV